MSVPNPQVSVFHFSSKISKAKIRKYKLATERGMVPALKRQPSTENAASVRNNESQPKRVSAAVTDPSPALSGPPPAKRPRLKLNVKPLDHTDAVGDTIAVSRPQQRSTQPTHNAEDLEMIQHRPSEGAARPKPQQPSALSSRTASPSTKLASDFELEPRNSASITSRRQDYGDFMSYYIVGGDEDEGENEHHKSRREPPSLPDQTQKSLRAKSIPTKETIQKPSPLPPQLVVDRKSTTQTPKARRDGMVKPSHYQRFVHESPPSAKPPPVVKAPVLRFVDIVHKSKPAEPDTVARMIERLNQLSQSLTGFGAVSGTSETPPPENITSHGETQIDKFLALFEVDSDDDNVDQKLPNGGTPDESLTYGIMFIQNALKSWAHQRLHQHYAQQTQQIQEQQVLPPVKRPRGRPRKSDDSQPQPSQWPSVVELNLADTPEGAAIAAFQAVLDSGCLQVNTILPAELSRALRKLYMQIDRLINQGSPDGTPWRRISYRTQIASHQARIDKVKESHALAQAGMARQQSFADHQTVLRMGAQGGLGPATLLTPAEAQRAHAIELEKRRSLQHAAQQPYNSHLHLHPLQFGHSGAYTPLRVSSSASVQNGRSTMPTSGQAPSERPVGGSPSDRTGASPPDDAPELGGDGAQLDKVRMYMPGFLPRSGQSMKFSFTPQNEAAVRIFGSQAFPGPLQSPSTFTPKPTAPSAHRLTPHGFHQTAATTSGPSASPSDVGTHAADIQANRLGNTAVSSEAVEAQNHHFQPMVAAPPQSVGFRPINDSNGRARPRDLSSRSSTPPLHSTIAVSMQNFSCHAASPIPPLASRSSLPAADKPRRSNGSAAAT